MTADIGALLNTCEMEQLHLSGAVQGFGALLRVAHASDRVTHASANLEALTGLTPAEVLDRPFEELGWPLDKALSCLPDRPGANSLLLHAMQGPGGWLDAHLSSDGSGTLVELEPSATEMDPLAKMNVHQWLVDLMAVSSSAEELNRRIVKGIRAITGFDRVMLYRFAEDWSGEVIAEATTPELGSYQGLRFPASDIPAIARNIYLLNPVRIIPDVSATPVPITSLDHTVPDLTWSALRSVSPVHLQYLTNMGVEASLSIPVKITGKLWGLLACHNRLPRYIHASDRQHCIDMVRTYALSLTAYNANQRLRFIDSADDRVERVLEILTKEPDLWQGVDIHNRLVSGLVAADGVVLAMGERRVYFGETPETPLLDKLDRHFLGIKELILSTDHLATLLPGEDLGRISGMLAIKANVHQSRVIRLYWFRQELPRQVKWAGNPNKPMLEDEAAGILTPRRSFERWVELKRGHSAPWSTDQTIVALKFRSALLRWL